MGQIVESWEDEDFPLVEAAKELKSAAGAYGRLVSVGIGNFNAYDRAWRDFLHCIERAWNKIGAEAEGRKNWPKLKSEYEGMRNSDQLLRYMIQARNVSEHTVDPVMREWEPSLKVIPVGNKVQFQFDEWDRPLLPVTNRGTLFKPPKKHLGKPMTHYRKKGVSEPRTVAELTMKFYVNVINRVSSEVFPGGRA